MTISLTNRPVKATGGSAGTLDKGLPSVNTVIPCAFVAGPSGLPNTVQFDMGAIGDGTLPAGAGAVLSGVHTLNKITACEAERTIPHAGLVYHIRIEAFDSSPGDPEWRASLWVCDGTNLYKRGRTSIEDLTPVTRIGGLIDGTAIYDYSEFNLPQPTSPPGLPGWPDMTAAAGIINAVSVVMTSVTTGDGPTIVATETGTITAASISAGSTHGSVTFAGSDVLYEADPTDDVSVVIDYTVDGVTNKQVTVTTVVPTDWVIVDKAKHDAVGGTATGSRNQPYDEFNWASLAVSNGGTISVAGSQAAYLPINTTADMSSGPTNAGTRGIGRWVLHDRTNVTVRAHATTTGHPRVDGQLTSPGSTLPRGSNFGLVELTNCRSCTFKDHEVMNSHGAGITVRNVTGYNGGGAAGTATSTGTSSGVVVEGCYVHHTKTYGIISTPQDYSQSNNADGAPNDITIRHNRLSEVCTESQNATSISDVWAGEGIRVQGADVWEIAHNEVTSFHKEGIDFVNSSNGSMHHNYVHASRTDTWYRAVQGIGAGIYADSLDGSTNNSIHSNIVSGDRFGISIGDERGSAAVNAYDGLDIYNNIAFDNQVQPFGLTFTAINGAQGPSKIYKDIRVYNNIFHCGNASDAVVLDEPSGEPGAAVGAAQYPGFELRRNIIETPNTSEFVVRDSGTSLETALAGGVSDNIVKANGGSAVLYGSGSASTADLDVSTVILTNFWPVYTNPAWASRDNPSIDHQIAAGSPAVVAGSPLAAVPLDIVGATRTDATRGAILP